MTAGIARMVPVSIITARIFVDSSIYSKLIFLRY